MKIHQDPLVLFCLSRDEREMFEFHEVSLDGRVGHICGPSVDVEVVAIIWAEASGMHAPRYVVAVIVGSPELNSWQDKSC
jgi:hypothetical protein